MARGLVTGVAGRLRAAHPSPVPADGRSANVSRGYAAAINCRQRIADLLLRQSFTAKDAKDAEEKREVTGVSAINCRQRIADLLLLRSRVEEKIRLRNLLELWRPTA